MRFSPLQYKFIQSLVQPKIEELREAWKASTDEEETERLGQELALALRAWETVEDFYIGQ